MVSIGHWLEVLCWLFMEWMSVCQTCTCEWCVKVIRRPYMFVYRSEKDHRELDVINVASALIEFSEETTSMIRVPSLCPINLCLYIVSVKSA